MNAPSIIFGGLTVSANSTVVNITTSEDASFVNAYSLLVINNYPPVVVKKGTSSTIELVTPWPYSNVSSATPGFTIQTGADVTNAAKTLLLAYEELQLRAEADEQLYTETAQYITITDSKGVEHQFTTYPWRENKLNELQAQAESLVGSVVLPTKADFFSRHYGKFAGSGFGDFGSRTNSASYDDVNSGLLCRNDSSTSWANSFRFTSDLYSNEKSPHLYLAGSVFLLSRNAEAIKLPPAPDGLDKKDGTGRFSSISEAETAGGSSLSLSSLSPRDFSYLRTPRNSADDHNVTQSGYMFTDAFRQSTSTSIDGVATDGTQPAHFYQDGIYSADDTTVGTTVSHTKLLANPKLMENTWQQLYADSNGDIRQKDLQARTRRTENTLPCNWTIQDLMTAFGLNFDGNKNEFYRTEDGIEYAIEPVSFIQRRNQMAFHQVHNYYGTKGFGSSSNAGLSLGWNEAGSLSATSVAECYLNASTSGSSPGAIAGTASRCKRPGGKFYDEISESDFLDLRMSAHYVDHDTLNRIETAKNINATARGWDASCFTLKTSLNVGNKTLSDGATWLYGNTGYPSTLNNKPSINFYAEYCFVKGVSGEWYQCKSVFSDSNLNIRLWGDYNSDLGATVDVVVCYKIPYYQSVHTWTDIVTAPDTLTTTFPNGVAGSWIPVVPDDSSKTFKLNRRMLGQANVLRTNDNGASYQTGSIPVNNGNSFTGAIESDYLGIWSYEAKSNFVSAANLAKKLSNFSDVLSGNSHIAEYGCILAQSTIGKIPTADVATPNPILHTLELNTKTNTSPSTGILVSNRQGCSHDAINLFASSSPAWKCVAYITERNGQLYQQVILKGIHYDTVDGFGDNNIFEITDGVKTKTDLNGNTVIYGCWERPLLCWANRKVS